MPCFTSNTFRRISRHPNKRNLSDHVFLKDLKIRHHGSKFWNALSNLISVGERLLCSSYRYKDRTSGRPAGLRGNSSLHEYLFQQHTPDKPSCNGPASASNWSLKMISSHNIVPIDNDTKIGDWIRLFDAYLTLLSVDLPCSDKARLFERLTETNGKLRGFLLLSPEEEAIGFAHYIYHEDNWQPQPLCYLDDIYVQPACRRQGGGLALINAAKTAVEKEGCRRLYWMTEKEHHARSLYDKVAESTKVVYRIKL